MRSMLGNIFRILPHELIDLTLGTMKKVNQSMNQSMERCKGGLIRTSLDKSRTHNESMNQWNTAKVGG